ncbi:MAG TPA: hypothetical protein VM100_03035 [Longimicrobiales bacterium]|nr:hypothetical protein [Longimicrobiales bacterium]
MRGKGTAGLITAAGAGIAVLLWSGVAWSQDPLGWNSQQAREMIIRARARRELPRGDSSLTNYRAKANGYVYFYLDRREDTERTLVKVDQIAIDLFWKRPNLTKQHIVGLRDASRLPNRMYYHLDHLTVVQNNLGDVIRVGDGDEVRDVPHPAAPGADTIYDYRLADSVTLHLGSDQGDVRVYEVQVRPRRTNRPAFVGSVFVDRSSADIVRMTFTFTPASYVDKRLDYINLSLDNGLFGGRYWLPNEQSVEIRRQLPELDFVAGAVIKGRMRVSGYEFNAEIPDSVFHGRSVTAVSEAERKQYAFPEDIYAGLNTEGLAPPPQMEDLRKRAAELIGTQRLSGLPRLRLDVPNSSSVLRRNDAEGWFAGIGVAYVPSPGESIRLHAGYAFALGRPELSLTLRAVNDKATVTQQAYFFKPRDIGFVPGMPGALNTLSVTFGGRDYTNLMFANGFRADVATLILPSWEFRGGAGLEWQRAGRSEAISAKYPAEQIIRGQAISANVGLNRQLKTQPGFAWGSGLGFSVTHFRQTSVTENPFGLFERVEADVNPHYMSTNKRRDIDVRLRAAHNFGVTPAQYHFFLGGRETLPGYGYREFVDDASLFVGKVEVTQTIAEPWARLRLLGYAAHTRDAHLSGGDIIYTVYENRLRGSAGVGMGLLWDVIHIDVVKGARWQTLFSVKHDFWDLL